MKLSTRIKLSYIFAFVLPVIVIVAMVFAMLRFTMTSLQKRYDLDSTGYKVIMDPADISAHSAASIMKELNEAAENTPDLISDSSYLEDINSRLNEINSFLDVYRDNTLIYSGEDAEHSMNKAAYYIRRVEFDFSDGTAGMITVFTDASELTDTSVTFIVQVVVVSLIVLFAFSAVTMWKLYYSVARPVRKLKAAVDNMADGNLDVPITAESDDEIGELCEAFEAMRVKLKTQIDQNLQQEKDNKELISNISHDLKTPMTSIKGYVEGLLDGVADTPEKRERYLKTIHNKANDMQSLIDELFLYSKLDSGSVTYQFVKINADDYFQDCVDEIRIDLEEQGAGFQYYSFVDRDTVIVADPERLKRVINNIIGNSVKYESPDRPLKIEMRLLDEPEYIKLEIEDNGKGIAQDEVAYIFDRLYRTDASRNSKKGGSGLGLSIAKKIIEAHGGKIWARSKEGEGTTMVFALRKYREPEQDTIDWVPQG
ncbi:MAG: HAMP domain-containing histidine kinase [Lachnospiraceae bacterium]|nr:HAMP domain-containing histidine kinase [Lachnospiraceae bacterium]